MIQAKQRYAMLFPGQGSQSLGMLQDFSTEVAGVFKTASKILRYDLWELIQVDPQSLLDRTEYTQVALLTASVSLWHKWQKSELSAPAMLAGHSLGEYSALVAAQSLQFEDAVLLVAERGRLMQTAVTEGKGAMAAIVGLDNQTVLNICDELKAQNQLVDAANFNAPGQVVVAGLREAVNLAVEVAKTKGAKLVKVLAVSAPAHCKLMQPAADEFARYLENTKFTKPRYPVLRNIDADLHIHPDDIRQALLAQLVSPVRWVSCVQRIAEEGISKLVECGPGNVLSNLAKRIDPRFTGFNTNNLAQFERAVAEINKLTELEGVE